MDMTKDEPLFSDYEEDDSDDDGDRGAIYSGFEGVASNLFDPSDFDVRTTATFDTTGLTDRIIPDEAFDRIRNAIDDRDQRGVKDNPLCLYEGLNTEDYYDAVYLLALGGWKKIDLDDEDWERYLQRKRSNWRGTDSLHDALLLIKKDPREAFDMRRFLSKCKHWSALHMTR